ncbi:MAG: condensation domain-containing protein, partial [Psychrosphaera sp.]|nr:condensation domain-containing protein [Psychrosphaera sp.]
QFDPLPNSEIAFNYLGQFDQLVNDTSHFSLASESRGEEVSSARQSPHPLTFNGMVIDGQLTFTLSFEQSRYHASAMNILMQDIAEALTDIIGHCSTTEHGAYIPADFPLAQVSDQALSQWQLDSIGSEVEALYPATSMQQGLLFHSALAPGSYVTQMLLQFEQLNVGWFKQAWLQVVQRHGIFRTAFVGLEQGNAHQLVYKTPALTWYEEDFSELDTATQNTRLAAVQAQDKINNFAADEAPLMRMTLIDLGGGDHQLIWSHHHALLDGWCLPLVFGEVTECYRALQDQDQPQLATVMPYRQYLDWLAQQSQAQAVAFWQSALADIFHPTPLPLVHNRAFGHHQNSVLDAQSLT